MVGGCQSQVVTSLDHRKGFYQAIYQRNARIFLYQLVYDTWQNQLFYKNGEFKIDFFNYVFLNTDISLNIRLKPIFHCDAKKLRWALALA